MAYCSSRYGYFASIPWLILLTDKQEQQDEVEIVEEPSSGPAPAAKPAQVSWTYILSCITWFQTNIPDSRVGEVFNPRNKLVVEQYCCDQLDTNYVAFP